MLSFLEIMRLIPDYRVVGMVTYPLDEILLATLVGVLCGADDWDEIEDMSQEYLAWLRQFLPYKNGIPKAQTFRKTFSLLPPKMLEKGFAAWASSLQEQVRGVIAVDGKTLRGSRKSAKKSENGSDALHLLSAYACEAGLVIGQRAVDGKSNEITAIPELLDMLAIKGAIISIDAMGTQKAIAEKIIEKEADYVLALKGNQGSLHNDIKEFFADGELAKTCHTHQTTDGGHGRIEERKILATDDIEWLKNRHPEWKNLTSIAAITAKCTIKKTGESSMETRFYITSLPANPNEILAATRAHWAIENNLHWQLDVTFNEDKCRVRKDFAPHNLAIIRHMVINMLKQDKSKISLKRKRLKALMNPDFRTKILAC
jgi:predicted transposase YbfD/YdcC